MQRERQWDPVVTEKKAEGNKGKECQQLVWIDCVWDELKSWTFPRMYSHVCLWVINHGRQNLQSFSMENKCSDCPPCLSTPLLSSLHPVPEIGSLFFYDKNTRYQHLFSSFQWFCLWLFVLLDQSSWLLKSVFCYFQETHEWCQHNWLDFRWHESYPFFSPSIPRLSLSSWRCF